MVRTGNFRARVVLSRIWAIRAASCVKSADGWGAPGFQANSNQLEFFGKSLVLVNHFLNKNQSGGRHMSDHDKAKAKALHSQIEICERMAAEIRDPELAEKLRALAEKLKQQESTENPV